ncbi:MAG: oxidoreductase [Maricaulis sp.]|jgi:isopenicillin N synthase-like dioxygenase|nr:oxidoreductase [Maricaulis sp.]HAQ35967.1 isopenicillin N synthase family oxygenase [Alphaproteobacteria bacterium]
MSDAITHLDLTDFTGGSDASRAQFVDALMRGLTRYGFITLSGHGVDAPLLEASYRISAEFFALPEEEKLRHAGALRGYTPFGTEHAKDHEVPDLKEFWQIGHESRPGMPAEHANVWPDTPGAFRPTFETLFDRLYEAGNALLGAIAIGLDLPEDWFEARIAGGTSLLRLLHYPPIPDGTDPHAIRAAAHEDINLITLLVAAEGSGLELLDRDGRWLPVESERGHLIVDTGDMMARLTGGVLPATTHRVINPDGANVSRYSMPFFVQPRSEVVLDCVPSCRERGQAEPPVTVREFLNQRLREIGLPAA